MTTGREVSGRPGGGSDVTEPKKRKTPVRTGPQKEKLDALGLDGLCSLILNGESQRGIAAKFGMSPMSLLEWIAAQPVRSARVREARAQSADAYAEKAEEVLLGASEPAMIPQARELASHYRWMASKRRPAEYGDKQQVDLTATVKIDPAQVEAKIKRLLQKAQA